MQSIEEYYTSYYTFRNRYASMVDRNVGSHSFKLVTGYVRLDELNDKLNKFSYRVLKEDCLDLPDKIYMKRFVMMTPEQTKLYEEMKKHALAELDGKMTSAASALAQMVRLHQITCGHLATDDGEVTQIKNNRINELLDVIEETNGKIIIWAIYRHDIKKIEETLAERYGKESVKSFYGDTADKLKRRLQKDMERNLSNLFMVILLTLIGRILLTLFKMERAIYDFLWETLEPEVMVLLLPLVILLYIIATVTI